MKRTLPFFLAVLAGTPLLAWQQSSGNNMTRWEFQGSEIVWHKVVEPAENEDPTMLEVSLWSPNTGAVVLSIEADLGVGDCPQKLSNAASRGSSTVVLVANLNATTLNGVTLHECSVR